MYQRLSENYTKKYYLNLLESTRQIILNILKQEGNPLWNSILSQIEDMQHKVNNNTIGDWEDVYERYSLGSIAVNCFSDNDEMQLRLMDIFFGIVHFNELSNE